MASRPAFSIIKNYRVAVSVDARREAEECEPRRGVVCDITEKRLRWKSRVVTSRLAKKWQVGGASMFPPCGCFSPNPSQSPPIRRGEKKQAAPRVGVFIVSQFRRITARPALFLNCFTVSSRSVFQKLPLVCRLPFATAHAVAIPLAYRPSDADFRRLTWTRPPKRPTAARLLAVKELEVSPLSCYISSNQERKQ